MAYKASLFFLTFCVIPLLVHLAHLAPAPSSSLGEKSLFSPQASAQQLSLSGTLSRNTSLHRADPCRSHIKCHLRATTPDHPILTCLLAALPITLSYILSSSFSELN